MIERKCEKTWPFQYLLRSLVNTMLAAPCSLAIAAAFRITFVAQARSDAICSGAESRSSMPTDPWRDYPASIARRMAANISGVRIGLAWDLADTEFAIYGM